MGASRRWPLDVHDAWFVATAIASLFVVTLVPHLLARTHAPPGYVYTGFLTAGHDTSAYYSFVHQAREGRWLFENRHTGDPHPAALVNVQWLLAGWVGRLTGWADPFLNQAWRAVGVTAVLGLFWALAGTLVRTRAVRRIALVAFATGAGFGWAFVALGWLGIVFRWDYPVASGWRPAPYDVTVGTTFRLFSSPFHATSYALLLLAILLLVRGEEKGRLAPYIGCGLCGLALSSHPYEAVTLLATLGLYTGVMRGGRSPARGRRLLAIGLTAAGLAYLSILFIVVPAFRWPTPLPPVLPLHTLAVHGLAAVGAVAALPAFVGKAREGSAAHGVIGCLLVANVALYYAHPFLEGSGGHRATLMLPVLLVAITFVDDRWRRWAPRRGVVVLVVLVLAVNALSNAVGYARQLRAVTRQTPPPAFYVPAGLQAAAAWLEAAATPRDLAVAPSAHAHWFVARGTRLYAVAHGTPRMDERRELVGRFYGADPALDRERWLRAEGIRYVVAGPDPAGLQPADAPYLARRFSADGFAVYELTEVGRR